MATHSSIHAWKIPCTGEPDRLQSMGSQRVRHDWSVLAHALQEIHFISFLCILFRWVNTIKYGYAFLFIHTPLLLKEDILYSASYLFHLKKCFGDFSGGPVAKTLCSQSRGPGFDPWSENWIPQATIKTWYRARHPGMWSQVGLRKHHYEQS